MIIGMAIAKSAQRNDGKRNFITTKIKSFRLSKPIIWFIYGLKSALSIIFEL